MKNITIEQVEDWLGSDCDRETILFTLTLIANGFYPAEQLKKDIEQYTED